VDLVYIVRNGSVSGSSQFPEIRESVVGCGAFGLRAEERPFWPAALSVFSGVDMPAIIRWFPVTHDINADPEMWELREQFGDRAGFVWLEILSIADRNNGILGPSSSQLHTILAGRCRVYSPKVRAILEWCLARGWLVFDGNLRVAKWLKYHRTREPNKHPTGNTTTPLLPNLPNLPKEEDKIKTPIAPKMGAMLESFDLFWKEYPKKRGKETAERAWLKIAPNNGLCETIITAIKKQKTWPDWVKDCGQFIPYPASWLNQKRWEDEIGEQKEERTGVWAKKFTPEPK